ncbi:MAG: glycosyltransferase [Acidobacteriales bacterium]|nr:glycosyltransferase [Terriglobales bacterium]
MSPLHIGKSVPPPYAGIEAHIDTLLRSISPHVNATLVACEHIHNRGRPALVVPYRLLSITSYATVASVAISPALLPAVRREFVSGRANLLHVHVPNPWGDIAALSLPKDVPVVMTWHSDIVRQRKLMVLYGKIQQRALERADRIVVFTPKHYESSTQLVGRDLERKIVSIPIGIDFGHLDAPIQETVWLEEMDRWIGERPLILTVGRHVYYKGYDHLINAVRKLRSDAVLLMIGTGPLTHALQKQSLALGLENRIRFAGEVDNASLVAALHRCDLFCLPSISPAEALGIASAEAMACGKPTVVCQLNNGVNYLNVAGRTGLVTPPRDETALADAIDILVMNDKVRSEMGRAAYEWVRTNFSVGTMRDGTLALYQSLC